MILSITILSAIFSPAGAGLQAVSMLYMALFRQAIASSAVCLMAVISD